MNNYFSCVRKLQMLTVILILTGIFLLICFAQPYPKAEEPKFSVESGFYQEPFYLEIAAPDGCTVYYTLDGSLPDKNSCRYTEPILIENATGNPNTNSMRTDLSPVNSRNPDFLIDKCSVIRAVAVADSGSKLENSTVVTKSYFVGFPKEYADNCSVVSLVTDPDNFFDYDSGIYVTGRYLDRFVAAGLSEEEAIYYWDANYWQKGREWERDASVTFFDPEGNLILSKEIGTRIQGGASRAYIPRSLNLYAREEYDGEGTFAYDFFGTGFHPAAMTLSVSGNQLITRLDDYFMAQCVGMPEYSTMHYRPCILFLNGEYWGFYWLTEKYDAAYIQHRYQLQDADVIMIKNSEVAVGYDRDLGVFTRMYSFVSSADMSVEENYAEACRLIDMDSYIDYYATMIYIARSLDWPGYNEAIWRSREITDVPYMDGKWRWMMFDCNSDSMTSNLIEHDTLSYVIEWSPIFASLWDNPNFRSDFEKRILELADTCFAEEKVISLIEEYRRMMEPPLTKNWARFHGAENDMAEQYHAILNDVEAFFKARRPVVERWFD